MSPNNKDSYYQFNEEETNFFKQLSKQPYYEKAISDIQQELNTTLTTNNINLTKIISTIIAKWQISYKDIASLRENNFEKSLQAYKETRVEKNHITSILLLNYLDVVIAKIPHVLSWLTEAKLNPEQERLRDINIFWKTFLKSLESIEWLIFNDAIIIPQDDYSNIEAAFERAFKVNWLQAIRTKLTKLWLANFSSPGETIRWKTIIDKLYSLVDWAKRPKKSVRETQEYVTITPDDELVNTQTNLWHFIHSIQNAKASQIYTWAEMLWWFQKKFDTFMLFTVWTYSKEGGHFISVSVPLPYNEQAPQTGTLKKIRITNVEQSNNLRFPLNITWEIT